MRAQLYQACLGGGANSVAIRPNGVFDRDRVFSAYELRDGSRVGVITEADRSVTTILLPEEY